MQGPYVAVSVALREDDSFVLFITLIILTHSLLRTPLETLRSNDATATGTSLERSICVLSVFIAIVPTHLLELNS